MSRAIGAGFRLGLLAACVSALTVLLTQTQFYATDLVMVIVTALTLAEFLRHAGAANRQMDRLIEALGQGDFIDRPEAPGLSDASAPPLVRAFLGAQDRLRQRTQHDASERARLSAMVALAPVPLLAIEADGRVELLNRAARLLFAAIPLARTTDLRAVSPELVQALDGTAGSHLVRLALPRGERRCIASIARTLGGGRNTVLVALQNIEAALEASEIGAWEALVRVLAHEIMNSLTPVASLAQTAALMLDEITPPGTEDATLLGLGEALDAIERRSIGLIRFIDGYRRFAEPPTPQKRTVSVSELFDRARLLCGSLLERNSVHLTRSVVPPSLAIEVDPDLLDQVLLNLLKNAIEAARGQATPEVTLTSALDPATGRAFIDIGDNGPGVPEDVRNRIFVPFFTTKQAGSGIGLPIVRQIMLGHGGSIELLPTERGAVFRLIF
jgi:nitrogen fixation/metabolism regulation signal transduction histidine kinase